MKVSQLIEQLKGMPQNAVVSHVWDGASRTIIQHVWLARSGEVCTADSCMNVWCDEDRPVMGPTCKEESNWKTESIEDEEI